MPTFDGYSISDEVVEAFASQVQDRTIVITGAGQGSIGGSIAMILVQASLAHIIIASRTTSKIEPVLAQIKNIIPITNKKSPPGATRSQTLVSRGKVFAIKPCHRHCLRS